MEREQVTPSFAAGKESTGTAIRLLGAGLLILGAIAAPGASAQERTRERGDYKIGASDILRIVVWKNAELSAEVLVRPDGMISLPLLNDVRAAGLTPMELRDSVTEKLTEYMSSPQVSIIVSEVHSFKVSILGKVQRPGRYELNDPATVLDVLALAGGFQDFSSPADMYVLRPQAETYQRIPVNYLMAISVGGKAVNITLKPGDFIVVP